MLVFQCVAVTKGGEKIRKKNHIKQVKQQECKTEPVTVGCRKTLCSSSEGIQIMQQHFKQNLYSRLNI